MAKKAEKAKDSPQKSDTPADEVAPVEAKTDVATDQPIASDEPQEGFYNAEPLGQESIPQTAIDPVSWKAAEFVHHEKTPAWYTGLIITTVAIAGLFFLITRDVVSVVVAVVAGILMAVYANRKPRQLDYIVDNSGLTIGPKHYSFQGFKSFSTAPEGTLVSVVFMPLKRFAPSITIYFNPEIQQKVMDVVSAQLPLEEHKLDAVDKLMKQIRF